MAGRISGDESYDAVEWLLDSLCLKGTSLDRGLAEQLERVLRQTEFDDKAETIAVQQQDSAHRVGELFSGNRDGCVEATFDASCADQMDPPSDTRSGTWVQRLRIASADGIWAWHLGLAPGVGTWGWHLGSQHAQPGRIGMKGCLDKPSR